MIPKSIFKFLKILFFSSLAILVNACNIKTETAAEKNGSQWISTKPASFCLEDFIDEVYPLIASQFHCQLDNRFSPKAFLCSTTGITLTYDEMVQGATYLQNTYGWQKDLSERIQWSTGIDGKAMFLIRDYPLIDVNICTSRWN